MTAESPSEWRYTGWLLIVYALEASKHGDCRYYKCDTIDDLRGDIAYYWNPDNDELAEVIADVRTLCNTGQIPIAGVAQGPHPKGNHDSPMHGLMNLSQRIDTRVIEVTYEAP